VIDKNILRIIDVNINRAKEGLRVCEDITRFILNDTVSTKALKLLRHKIKDIVDVSGINKKLLYKSRDSKDDCGINFCALEQRTNWQSIFQANMQRSKEALRVLEEFFKLSKGKTAELFKDLRFKLYSQEKHITEKHLNDTD
jgi:hypothetical protein